MNIIKHNCITILFLIMIGCGSIGCSSATKTYYPSENEISTDIKKGIIDATQQFSTSSRQELNTPLEEALKDMPASTLKEQKQSLTEHLAN